MDMAYVNKTSLREEFDHLKAEFERLSGAGKITPESRLLFTALLTLFEVMMAIFLEKTTKKGNRNSSKPSSQVDKDETASVPGGHAKGLAQDDTRFANSRTIERVEVSAVSQCSCCGEALVKAVPTGYERRSKIDIVFEKVVRHIDAEIKSCAVCGSTTKGEFPADMPGPLQYGLGIKAYVLNLLITQMISLSRVQKLLKTLLGTTLSEATVLRYILQLHQALEAWERDSVAQLLACPTIHVDETSLRVDKRNHWVHIYCSGQTTVKFLHRRRGQAAIDAINIIPRYGGVIIHDCWASYLSYGHCRHGLCGAHLLRELTFVIEAHGYAWAANIKKLLQETCVQVSKSKTKQLSAEDYANLQKRYRNLLTRGRKELPPLVQRPSGKRGRIAKPAAHNLFDRLREHEQAVLLFAKKAEVSFTNNRAERDLRMSKVKQKVSGCFRQEQFAQAYCRISSYLQTMAYKGFNPLVAIQLALSGELYARGPE